MLLTADDSVLDVALWCGFQATKHSAVRFDGHFAMTPSTPRERGFADNVDTSQAGDHAALANKSRPALGCITAV
jgi:hypothetical protein